VSTRREQQGSKVRQVILARLVFGVRMSHDDDKVEVDYLVTARITRYHTFPLLSDYLDSLHYTSFTHIAQTTPQTRSVLGISPTSL
jgi:hypothetical protein